MAEQFPPDGMGLAEFVVFTSEIADDYRAAGYKVVASRTGLRVTATKDSSFERLRSVQALRLVATRTRPTS